MNHQDVVNKLRTELSGLVTQMEGNSAMGLTDLPVLAEGVVLGLFRELWDLPNLRNLNATEQKNYPGIDLADSGKRVAVQVTATSTLDKVKDTVKTFLAHGLEKHYDTLLIYVLTRKQGSYSGRAIEALLQGRLVFNAEEHVLDYKDLLSKAAHLPPARVSAALDVVLSYVRGGKKAGLANEDFDPPGSSETVDLNLVGIQFPSTLYLAELQTTVQPSRKGGKPPNMRNVVREELKSLHGAAPTDFEVRSRQVITFEPLEDTGHVFSSVIDQGTVTPISTVEYAGIDQDHERILKSLLRRCLQNKLFRKRVQWMHEEELFVFMPLEDHDPSREEAWVGKRKSSRVVFERKMNRTDPTKTLMCRHFAFSVEFLRVDSRWFVALTPDWYFSHGDGFQRSNFADENLSWIKRRENNQTVGGHFRFLVSWLKSLEAEDLFQERHASANQLSFSDRVQFTNHPTLADGSWLPMKYDHIDESDAQRSSRLFDSR